MCVDECESYFFDEDCGLVCGVIVRDVDLVCLRWCAPLASCRRLFRNRRRRISLKDAGSDEEIAFAGGELEDVGFVGQAQWAMEFYFYGVRAAGVG